MAHPNDVQAPEGETQNLGEALQAMVDHAQAVLHWGAKIGVRPLSGDNGPQPPKPPKPISG